MERIIGIKNIQQGHGLSDNFIKYSSFLSLYVKFSSFFISIFVLRFKIFSAKYKFFLNIYLLIE